MLDMENEITTQKKLSNEKIISFEEYLFFLDHNCFYAMNLYKKRYRTR